MNLGAQKVIIFSFILYDRVELRRDPAGDKGRLHRYWVNNYTWPYFVFNVKKNSGKNLVWAYSWFNVPDLRYQLFFI